MYRRNVIASNTNACVVKEPLLDVTDAEVVKDEVAEETAEVVEETARSRCFPSLCVSRVFMPTLSIIDNY